MLACVFTGHLHLGTLNYAFYYKTSLHIPQKKSVPFLLFAILVKGIQPLSCICMSHTDHYK